MIVPSETATIGEFFFDAAHCYADRPLLVAPSNSARAYDPQGRSLSYAEAAHAVHGLMAEYGEASSRVACILE